MQSAQKKSHKRIVVFKHKLIHIKLNMVVNKKSIQHVIITIFDTMHMTQFHTNTN